MPFFILVLTISMVGLSCTKKSAPQASEMSPAQLSERGAAIYKLNCIACHNPDPKLDGAVGPAIHGASLELLEARILKAQYPPEYKPKRETKLMPAQPLLEKEIPALQAFLSGT